MSPRPSMPPPGEKKPAVVVAIGTDKPKEGEPDGASGKASPEEAIVLRAGDKVCGTCANYQAESGDCSAVEGNFEADDRCIRYWEAQGGADESETAPEGDEGGVMPPPGEQQ